MDEEVAVAQRAALWPDFWPYGARKPGPESFQKRLPARKPFSQTRGGIENAP